MYCIGAAPAGSGVVSFSISDEEGLQLPRRVYTGELYNQPGPNTSISSATRRLDSDMPAIRPPHQVPDGSSAG